MDIPKEIKKYSSKDDKPVLLALFEEYHWSTQWHFVARCSFDRYGKMSYEVNRVWEPTREGRCLYEHMLKKETRC